MQETIKSLLSEGGPVSWVILLLCAAIIIISIERYLYLHRCKIDTKFFLGGIINQLRRGSVKEAIVNCDNTHCPVGEILRSAIERWNDGENAIRQGTEECAGILIPTLERNMKLLSFMGNVAPVMGLMGTLLAMLEIYAKMKEVGGHFIETIELAGNIRNALVCTVLGLAVSVITQFLYMLLTEKIDKQILEMRKAAAEITYFLSTTKPTGTIEDTVLPQTEQATQNNLQDSKKKR